MRKIEREAFKNRLYYYIKHFGPYTLMDLVNIFRVHHSTVLGQLQALVKEGRIAKDNKLYRVE